MGLDMLCNRVAWEAKYQQKALKTGFKKYLQVTKAKRDLLLVAIHLVGQQPARADSIIPPCWRHSLHHSAGVLLL